MDHVDDVVWLPKTDSRAPPISRSPNDDMVITAEQWKDAGNDALKVGKLHEAFEWQEESLSRAESDMTCQ